MLLLPKFLTAILSAKILLAEPMFAFSIRGLD